jgi:hypothetical protein
VKLTIAKEGFKPFEQTLTASADATPISVSAELEPVTYGSLTLLSTPTAEVKLVSGPLSWQLKTPIEKLKLPPGNYDVILVNSLLQMQKRLSIDIQANKTLTQEITLDLVK